MLCVVAALCFAVGGCGDEMILGAAGNGGEGAMGGFSGAGGEGTGGVGGSAGSPGSECGDGVVEGVEECEVEEENCQGLEDLEPCTFFRTAFRMYSLTLLDPTIKFAPGCNEGIHPLVNNGLTEATVEDKSTFAPVDALDGLIDLGFVFTFGPQNQGDAESTRASFTISDCDRLSKPSPAVNPSPCSPTITQPESFTPFDITTQAAGDCLAVIPDTADQTVNPVVPGDNGCWVSPEIDFVVALGTVVQIPLSQTRIAATWDDDPASNIVGGLIRGFLSEEDAESTLIDPTTAFIGGQNLKQSFGSDLSMGDCDTRDDNDGVMGYWVYLAFEAETVPWRGGPMCGNGVVDSGGDRDELCDPGIAAGQVGDCAPLLDCEDGLVCTDDTPNNGDPCAPRCFRRAFNDADDCCPAEAMDVDAVTGVPSNDVDCVGLCNDGTLQDWENCDTAQGTACDDPAACDDGDACTNELGLKVIGTNPTVQNVCVDCPESACECKRQTIVQRIPDDGCCPAACTRISPPPPADCAADTDCPPP